jgi:hypothetical protein
MITTRRLVLLSILIQGAACACSQGYYKLSNTCYKCPAGQFSNTVDSLTCNACAPGTVAPTTGSTACVACSAGKHAHFFGLSACSACPSGTGSVAGAMECVSCANATVMNATVMNATAMNATAINATAINATAMNATTCRTAALKQCVLCPVACTACVAGKFNDGAGPKCLDCAPGTYSTTVQAISSFAAR